MKCRLLLIFSIFYSTFIIAQNQFFISGRTNFVSNGIAVLKDNAPDEFYSIKIKSDTVLIQNNTFLFEGTIDYPQQFRMKIINDDKEIITEPFFIDSGFQKISIDSIEHLNTFLDFGNGASIKGSPANNEYVKKYLPLFDSVNERIIALFSEVENCYKLVEEEIKIDCIAQTIPHRIAIRETRDSILLNYATQYPKSPITPWLLYQSLRTYGFKETYQNTFDQLAQFNPPNITKSLNDYIRSQSIKTVGSLFPLRNYIRASFNKNYIEQNKYTLVDFWFSSCVPCIAQFDSLKSIYNEYNKKGFEIIAISTDAEESIPDYKRIVKLKKYPWKQILDTSGTQAKTINIHKYPSGFLLDKDGRIIDIDIDPAVLAIFLKKNL